MTVCVSHWIRIYRSFERKNCLRLQGLKGPQIIIIIIIIIIMPKPVCEEGDVTVLWNQAVHTDRESRSHPVVW